MGATRASIVNPSRGESAARESERLAKGASTPVVKDATWARVGLHGTQWRVVAALAGAGDED